MREDDNRLVGPSDLLQAQDELFKWNVDRRGRVGAAKTRAASTSRRMAPRDSHVRAFRTRSTSWL